MKNSIKMLGNLLFIALLAIIGFTTTACPPEEVKQDTITISAILGVTAPVVGQSSVSEITPNAQYHGIVSWDPSSGVFDADTVYTATINLYENEGWTCKGVPANFFTVAGATATNDADSYVIKAVFPKTGFNTFSSITEFGTWLKNQRANTAETPFTVKLNIASLGGSSSDDGSVGSVVKEYISDWYYRNYRFVILDLSDSTMTSIEASAFYGCSNLIGLIMGDSVTSIGNYSFYNCGGITSVTIGKNVTSIGNSAFNGCSGLTSVNIPAGVTSIGDSVFNGCSKLTSVNIPAAVATIGDQVFSSCNALTAIDVDAANVAYISVDKVLYDIAKTKLIAYPAGKAGDSFTIPDGVTTILDNAFDGNRNLTGITIPASVQYLPINRFTGFAKLAGITVAEANTIYSSDNGVLYNKTKTNLIRHPASKTIVNGTFTIPSNVTSIGSYAFAECGITSITIPSNVNTIDSYAFTSCANLTSVTFEGTIDSSKFGNSNPFPGDLRAKYLNTSNGGAGTYTRSGSTWTKGS